MSDIVAAWLLALAGSWPSARNTPGGLLLDGGPAACAARGGVTPETTHKGGTAESRHRRSIRVTSNVSTLSSDVRA